MLICVMLKLKGSDGSILKEIWDREKPYSTTLEGFFVSWESTSYDIKNAFCGDRRAAEGKFSAEAARKICFHQPDKGKTL